MVFIRVRTIEHSKKLTYVWPYPTAETLSTVGKQEQSWKYNHKKTMTTMGIFYALDCITTSCEMDLCCDMFYSETKDNYIIYSAWSFSLC